MMVEGERVEFPNFKKLKLYENSMRKSPKNKVNITRKICEEREKYEVSIKKNIFKEIEAQSY